mmetsp:Transcript_27429/g.66804  ORF Transcript_27429/g.66804 Transcript_27429/m.66804 type:complete len:544 (-) Transcript_27429:61-1692(-)
MSTSGSEGGKSAVQSGGAPREKSLDEVLGKGNQVNLRKYGIQQLIPLEQFQHIQDSFNTFDRDGGGDISNEELGDVFKSMGLKPSPKELAQIVKELDEDMSGSVSFDEFLKLMVAPKFGSVGYKFIKSAVAGAQMVWSVHHVAVGLKLARGNNTAMRTDFWQVGSVRGENSLPKQGQAYFEVTFSRRGLAKGAPLNGFYYAGVCDSTVEQWDGLWRDDDRRNHMWGLRSETSDRPHKAPKEKRGATFGATTRGGMPEKPSRGELCGPECRGEPWTDGSSFGEKDVVGVFVDIDKRTLFFYKNGERLDDMAAFRGFAPDSSLYPFATLSHPDSQASLAFRPLPPNKPTDRVAVTAGGTVSYYSAWSGDYKSESFEVKEGSMTRATIGEISVGVGYTRKQISVLRPLSIRTTNPIKSDGVFYVELAITGAGRQRGTSLQGGNYIGVCGEEFQCWDGNWEYDDGLRVQVWALHDSMASGEGELSTETDGARRKWETGTGLDGETPVGYGSVQVPSGHPKALPGFGSGDRIGLYVVRTSGVCLCIYI